MRASAAAAVILSGLIGSQAVGQPPATFDRGDYVIASTLPAVEPEVRAYLKFFSQVQDLQRLRLSTDARNSLALSNAELRSLLTVTAHLATESRSLPTGTPTEVWSERILDHVQQLRAGLENKHSKE